MATDMMKALGLRLHSLFYMWVAPGKVPQQHELAPLPLHQQRQWSSHHAVSVWRNEHAQWVRPHERVNLRVLGFEDGGDSHAKPSSAIHATCVAPALGVMHMKVRGLGVSQ